MPAVSASQQRLFGMALAFKRGELEDASEEVRRLAEGTSEEKLEEFARTKRTGLPKRVEKAKAAFVRVRAIGAYRAPPGRVGMVFERRNGERGVTSPVRSVHHVGEIDGRTHAFVQTRNTLYLAEHDDPEELARNLGARYVDQRTEKAVELLREEAGATMTPEALFAILERGAFPELRKGIPREVLAPALAACAEVGVVPPGWLEKAASWRTGRRKVWVRGYVKRGGAHVPGHLAWRRVLIDPDEKSVELSTAKSPRPDAPGADLVIEVHPAVERASRIKERVRAALPEGAARERGGALHVAREHAEEAREIVRESFDTTADKPRDKAFGTEAEFEEWRQTPEGIAYREGRAAERLKDLEKRRAARERDRQKRAEVLEERKRSGAERQAGAYEYEVAGETRVEPSLIDKVEQAAESSQRIRREEAEAAWQRDHDFLEAHSRVEEVESEDGKGNVVRVKKRRYDSPGTEEEARQRYLRRHEGDIRRRANVLLGRWSDAPGQASQRTSLGVPGRSDLPEDLAQETVLRIMQNWTGFVEDRNPGAFMAWVTKMMQRIRDRHYRDFVRQGGPTVSLDAPVPEGEGGEGGGTISDALAAKLAAAEDVLYSVMNRTDDEGLAAIIDRANLKDDQRELARMVLIDGASVEEVARAHGANQHQIWDLYKPVINKLWRAGLGDLILGSDPKLHARVVAEAKVVANKEARKKVPKSGEAGEPELDVALSPTERAHRKAGLEQVRVLREALAAKEDEKIRREEAWRQAAEKVQKHWGWLEKQVEDAQKVGDELDRLELGISGSKGARRKQLVEALQLKKNEHRSRLGNLKEQVLRLEVLKGERERAGKVLGSTAKRYRELAEELRGEEAKMGVPEPAPIREDWLETREGRGAVPGSKQSRSGAFSAKIQAEWDRLQAKRSEGEEKPVPAVARKPGVRRAIR